jgi:hypothetical protein
MGNLKNKVNRTRKFVEANWLRLIMGIESIYTKQKAFIDRGARK